MKVNLSPSSWRVAVAVTNDVVACGGGGGFHSANVQALDDDPIESSKLPAG